MNKVCIFQICSNARIRGILFSEFSRLSVNWTHAIQLTTFVSHDRLRVSQIFAPTLQRFASLVGFSAKSPIPACDKHYVARYIAHFKYVVHLPLHAQVLMNSTNYSFSRHNKYVNRSNDCVFRVYLIAGTDILVTIFLSML